MKLKPCTEETSLLEADLMTADRQNNVELIQIMEVLDVPGRASEPGSAYYLLVTLKTSPKHWYFTTRRERDEPRLFRDLRRLRAYLKENFPKTDIRMEIDQTLPPTK